jgi:hypothetical protein
VAASALAGYFGRRLPEIIRHMRGHVAEVEFEDEGEAASDF